MLKLYYVKLIKIVYKINMQLLLIKRGLIIVVKTCGCKVGVLNNDKLGAIDQDETKILMI